MQQPRSIWQYFGYFLVIALQAIMATVGIWLLLAQDWKYASISLISVAYGFVPFLVNRFSTHIKLPIGFIATFVLFLFLSFFLGEVAGFYNRIELWDMALHFSSGILMVWAGFWWLSQLKRYHAVTVQVWLALFFAFCTSVTGGALWEVVEFLSDEWFGTHSQGDILDTMHDIIANGIGSLLVVASIGAYVAAQKLKNS